MQLKPGAKSLTAVAILSILMAVLANIFLRVSIEFAIGVALGFVVIWAWALKYRGINLPWQDQLQKVEWNALLFFIGIITAVSCLNHVGWLTYISGMFKIMEPTYVNSFLGVISGVLDNVPVEAAALMSNPHLTPSEWALNALMVGIGGSLTAVGSAAGVMAMSLDRTYTFGVHLKFMPAILVNFLGSLAVWYLQFEILGLH